MYNPRGPCRQAGPEEVVRGDGGDPSEAFQPPMERNGAALPPKLQLRNDPEGRRAHPLRERERLLALESGVAGGCSSHEGHSGTLSLQRGDTSL